MYFAVVVVVVFLPSVRAGYYFIPALVLHFSFMKNVHREDMLDH